MRSTSSTVFLSLSLFFSFPAHSPAIGIQYCPTQIQSRIFINTVQHRYNLGYSSILSIIDTIQDIHQYCPSQIQSRIFINTRQHRYNLGYPSYTFCIIYPVLRILYLVSEILDRPYPVSFYIYCVFSNWRNVS